VAQGLSTSLSPSSSDAAPKLNALPHEVEVVVTGARPGRSSSNRELFTEKTTTVLVFEKGAVIRLGAAVDLEQLVFVTHSKSKSEVVAQVTRKREAQPSSCYIEIEFTEAFPGFWGLEFPKIAETAAGAPAQKRAEKRAPAAQIMEDAPKAVSPAPNLEEVVALKEEVEALRKKLKQVESQAGDAASSPGSGLSSPAAEPASDGASQATRREIASIEEEMLPKVALDFRASAATAAGKKSVPALSVPRSETSRSSSKRTILLIAALLVAAVSAAYFEHWIPLPGQGKTATKIAAAAPLAKNPASASSVTTAASTPAVPSANSSGTGKTDGATLQNQAAQPAALNPAATAPVMQALPDAGHSATASGALVAEAEKTSDFQPVKPEKYSVVNTSSKRAILRAPVEMSTAPVADASNATGFVAPKLTKAARPNSPAEALQGFISGNVELDAVVDPTGYIKSTKVLSGPEKLRKAALDAVHDYKYEPALQNGKPVSAHVTVTVQFWYEP
jgi:TonB family protein